MGLEELILQFARAIAVNPNFEFQQSDRAPFYDHNLQAFRPEMKAHLTMKEADRYAKAYLSYIQSKPDTNVP